MRNVLLYSFAFFIACSGISVDAFPAVKDGDKMKEGDSNKTNIVVEKAARHLVGKSTRPAYMVPMYEPFVSPANMPSRFPPRLMQVLPPPQVSTYSIRSPPFFNRSPFTSSGYIGYQPQLQQMFAPPMSQFNPSLPTSPFSQAYQQQAASIMPTPIYNYAPYASNSYTAYGSRSVADEDEQLKSLAFAESQSTLQYPAAGGYVLNPQIEYQTESPTTLYVNEYSAIPSSELFSSGRMEPREVLSAGLSHNDVASMPSEMTDQTYYEFMNPYVTKFGQTVLPEQPPHLQQMNLRVTEPSTHLSITKPYVNSESVNYIWPRSDVPIFL